MERDLQHPVRADVPSDPLTADGPEPAARLAARVGLYVHVPFCAVRCAYCHFSTVVFEHGLLDRWLAALEREAARRAPAAAGVAFTSVYFGGGTPSALSARHFKRVWSIVRAHFALAPGAEVTLEANPESVREALLDAWAESGVNRLSMGAQSFEPGELAALGRVHDEHRPGEAVRLAVAHGFRRLSLDLIYGFPGHTLEAFERSLERALELPVEHLSAYAFIADRGTRMGDQVLAGRARIADDDAQADMYAMLLERAAGAGMRPYETSNVCQPGAESRHNLTYWLRRDYMALGPSAHGLWRSERWGNLWSTHEWADALEGGRAAEAEREHATPRSVADEIVMLGLRLGSGLRADDYAPAEWATVMLRFGAAFDAAVVAGRLERCDRGWRVPPAHRFVADDVMAWLLARGRD